MPVPCLPKPAGADVTPARTSRRPVRPGPGSYRVLDWVAQLGAAGIEPVQLALGISQGTAYCHARRLTAAGLMWHVPVNDGRGGIVAVTPRGATLARERGIAAVTPRSQAPSSGVHARAVSWVAARAETKGWPWLGPARLAEEECWTLRRDDAARHRPDLGIFVGDARTAVEVELHAKAPARLAAIMNAYRRKFVMGELPGCTYVVTTPYVEHLGGFGETASESRAERRYENAGHCPNCLLPPGEPPVPAVEPRYVRKRTDDRLGRKVKQGRARHRRNYFRTTPEEERRAPAQAPWSAWRGSSGWRGAGLVQRHGPAAERAPIHA